MSEEQIDRMVKEAQERAGEDDMAKKMVNARNDLENYAYAMRDIANDKDKLGEKLQASEREQVIAAVDEVLDFLEREMHPSVEKCSEMQKRIEDTVHPIFRRYGYVHHAADEDFYEGREKPSSDEDYFSYGDDDDAAGDKDEL